MHVIAVYGSSKIAVDGPDYESARAVGRALGAAGYAVMSGGYFGVMEAASRGAAEAGGHVIGVTAAWFDSFRDGPNRWVREEIKFENAHERLAHLVSAPHGHVVMPGGIGTLSELANVLDRMRTGGLSPRPVICYGDFWRRSLSYFLESAYVDGSGRQLVHFTEDPATVVAVFDQFFNGG